MTLCACAPREPVFIGTPPGTTALGAVLAANPPAPGENIHVTPLQRGEHVSLQLVQVRDREKPHVHTRYDLVVLLIRGHGVLRLGDAALAMRPGDVAFVPRGTPHFFVNDGQDPAAALVIFAPAFDGPDQVPVPGA